jgi:hypothetical protein
MTVVSDITTVANATNPATHNFTLVQYTSGANGRKIAEFRKDKKGETGTTGMPSATWGYGEDATSATTARTNALASLNAVRRHRYAGAPGSVSGATVATWPDGAATVPTVDSN